HIMDIRRIIGQDYFPCKWVNLRYKDKRYFRGKLAGRNIYQPVCPNDAKLKEAPESDGKVNKIKAKLPSEIPLVDDVLGTSTLSQVSAIPKQSYQGAFGK
ncbi:hypothetical protein OTU49_008179, partial [Cherax quadricarinatus]